MRKLHLRRSKERVVADKITVVGDGNRKDIRNAVEAASKAQGGWGKRAAHNRAQICFYIAENLEIRRAEFASRIAKMTGQAEKVAVAEVDAAIARERASDPDPNREGEGGGASWTARVGRAVCRVSGFPEFTVWGRPPAGSLPSAGALL